MKGHNARPRKHVRAHHATNQPGRLPFFERYVALAREASTSGDRVAAENLHQHAEHYFRVMNAANEGHRAMPPTTVADLETERAEEDGSEMAGPVRASLSNRQPYSA